MSTLVSADMADLYVDRRQVMIAVADALVCQVLTRVGTTLCRKNRALFREPDRMTIHCKVDISPRELEHLPKDCWDHVERFIRLYGCCGMDAPEIICVLDAYVVRLLSEGLQHSTPSMIAALAQAQPNVWDGV